MPSTIQEQNFEFKAMNGSVSVDEAKGIVECFVAGIGNKDSVGDIIVSGAFTDSLKRRKPRVVWGHDWNQPIGKVLEMYEVGPNDPRLPAKMKQAGIGGLYARVQFNLKSERGREAFANVLFFGEEQEWSIGYKTLDAIYDNARQANILKVVELYECSPVLHGANQLTSTISIKSDGQEMRSLRQSKWKMFDRQFAEMIKTEHPDIWDAGGNIKGDDQYEILTKIADQGGTAKTDDQVNAIKLREAWIARHKEDFRLPGVIAQIKWLAIGSRGEDYMKNVVREAIDKKMESKGHWRGGGDEDGPGIPAEMPSMYPKRVAMALSANLGGPVRLRELSKNQIVFDIMREGEVETMRLAYHFDGMQFMFGDPEKVKPTMVYLPEGEEEEEEGGEEEENGEETEKAAGPCWPGYQMVGMKPGKGGRMVPNCVPVKGLSDEMNPEEYLVDDEFYAFGQDFVKAPIPPDAIPQERITGDVLRGYGPRRGNLERLLRYWRPIMRREGGFRRCRVILADHPELYPLNNICAWLHHETTGLWPNEGCHHPGMKNCRRKLRGVVNGSIISDSQFNERLSRLRSAGGKSMMMDEEYGDVTDDDIKVANQVLRQFMMEEKEFMQFVGNDDNWEHVGDDEDGMEMGHPWVKPATAGGCGCGCGKSDDDSELDVKVGRAISNVNMAKIQQAIDILQTIVSSGAGPIEMKKKDDYEDISSVTLDEFVEPVLKYHEIDASFDNGLIQVKNLDSLSKEAIDALDRAVEEYHNL